MFAKENYSWWFVTWQAPRIEGNNLLPNVFTSWLVCLMAAVFSCCESLTTQSCGVRLECLSIARVTSDFVLMTHHRSSDEEDKILNTSGLPQKTKKNMVRVANANGKIGYQSLGAGISLYVQKQVFWQSKWRWGSRILKRVNSLANHDLVISKNILS